MKMEDALRALLLGADGMNALVGQRIDWGLRAQGKSLPAVELQEVSGVPGMTLTHPDGWTRSRVQIDVWGRTYAATRDVRDLILALLTGYRGTVDGVKLRTFVMNRRGGSDSDAAGPVHRASIDVMVWHRAA